MKKLTKEKLDALAPQAIFASGFGYIEHPWYSDATPVSEGGSLEPDGRSTKVRWVAVRGIAPTWSIYHSMDANICQADYFDCQCHLLASEEFIAKYGAKIHDEEIIQKLVPADEWAMIRYNH